MCSLLPSRGLIGRPPRLRNQEERGMVGLRAVRTRPRVNAAVRAYVH